MKKYLLTMLLTIAGCMTAMAGNQGIESLNPEGMLSNDSDLSVNHKAVDGSEEDIKGITYILVSDGEGQELNMEILSEEGQTLSVSPSRNGKNYDYAEVVIPDFVDYKDKTYSVYAIGKDAFKGEGRLSAIRLPNTLRHIYDKAFYKCGNLETINLPEGLETIGKQSFSMCGSGGLTKDVEEMHSLCTLSIPSTVREMDKLAFMYYGTMTSNMGQFQGMVENLPEFINEKTCSKYYISKESYNKYQLAKARQAGNVASVEVTSLADLKNSSGSVFIEVEYADATYDNQAKLSSEYSDLSNLIIDSTRELSAHFNKESKNWFIVKDKSDADVILRIYLTNVDRYFNPTNFGKSGFVTNLWGKAFLFDSKGNQAGEYVFDELSGAGQNRFRPSTGQSFINSMIMLGENLAKVFNDGK